MILKKTTKQTGLAILAGIGAFSLLKFALGLLVSVNLFSAMAVGLIVFAVFQIFLSNRSKQKTIVYEGVTREDLNTVIKSGKKLTAEMKQACNRLSFTDVKNEIFDVCNISDSMMDMLLTDPRDLRIVKSFITTYLEPTHKIILKYAELATARPMPADAIATLERTEQSLKNIRITFLQQKDRMHANDALDLDTEIKVFESSAGYPSAKPQSSADTDKNSANGNQSFPK
jgi:5-bromo-4-chloroindolyl phosphate hydrolysis protein